MNRLGNVGKIMALSSGELENDKVYALFQFLLDSGMIHSLQQGSQDLPELLMAMKKIKI
jgi:hypothetical protein